MDIKQRLKKLYAKDRLAHFYILQLDGRQNQSKLTFELKEIFCQQSDLNGIPRDLEDNGDNGDHPDILTLAPQGQKYLIEQPDFLEYMRSWEFRPTNLKYRFFIFTDAHLLSDVILNKMLKQLEEPPSWSCIFFLNPSGKKLLATIESRSLKWQIPPSTIPTWENTQGNFTQWLGQYCDYFLNENKLQLPEFSQLIMSAIKGDPWDLFEQVKKMPELERVLAQLTLQLAHYKISDYKSLDKTIEEFKNCQTSYEYNNNRVLRLEKYLSVWQKTLSAKR